MPLITRLAEGLRFEWQRLCVRARLLLGQTQQGVQILHGMQLCWPAHAWVLSSLATLAQQAGQLPEAAAWLRLATHHHPRQVALWFNLGFVLEQAGALVEAQAAFLHAVGLDPALDRAWYGLGLVCIQRQQWAAAVHALERTTCLQPMSPHAWYQLARVHAERGHGQAAHAVMTHLRGFEPRVADQLEREIGAAGSGCAA